MKRHSFYDSPLEGFMFHQQDEVDPVFDYYAFQNSSAEYYFLQENKSTGECLYFYSVHPVDYNADWAARATLPFDRPGVTFFNLSK